MSSSAAGQQPIEGAESPDYFFVCVECGRRQRRCIRQLQEGNYCLEECSQCKKTVDIYVEYESNLKLLQYMLCKPQIYRHAFFNYRQHDHYISKTLLLTAASLLVLYWQENRLAHKGDALWEDLPDQYPVFVSHQHMLMQRL